MARSARTNAIHIRTGVLLPKSVLWRPLSPRSSSTPYLFLKFIRKSTSEIATVVYESIEIFTAAMANLCANFPPMFPVECQQWRTRSSVDRSKIFGWLQLSMTSTSLKNIDNP